MNRGPLSFLCVGSATQDVYLSNSEGLAPVCNNPDDCFFNIQLGDKIYVNKVDFMTGGGASNAAVTFSRSGQHSSFMGTVGNDPAGQAVIKSFADEYVDYTYLSYSDEFNTDYSTLLLNSNGERTILTYRGCGTNSKKANFDLNKVKRQIDWIYLTSLVGHFEIYDDLLKKAKARDIKVAFNPGKKELAEADRLKPILSYIDIFSLNKEEAQMLVEGDTIEELAKKLRSYCPVVIVTDGIHGSVASDKTGMVRAGLYDHTENSIDRTGAGDAFCSGFTLSYALTGDIKQAMHFASANSSSVVMQVGAKTGILPYSTKLKNMQLKLL